MAYSACVLAGRSAASAARLLIVFAKVGYS